MKKKRMFTIIFGITVLSIAFCNEDVKVLKNNTEEKSWHLLERAKIEMEKKEFGIAFKYTNEAKQLHKKHITKYYEYLSNALKPWQVKKEGDNIADVYNVLKKREDYEACEILDEIFLTHPPIFFNKSISNLMSWLKDRTAFPETDYIIGQIYFAEGEYEQALLYYKEAWNTRSLLQIPDARFDIIYALANTSRLLQKYDDEEKYLLLVLTEDPMYGNTNLESPALKAMLKTITGEPTSEKFFLLYRHHNPIALKAYLLLSDIYLQAGHYERALTVSALASIIAVTNLDNILLKLNYNHSYENFPSLLHELKRKNEITEWAESQNFWKAFMNLAETLALSGYKAQASDLYEKIAQSVPSIKYAQEAVYKNEKLKNEKENW